MYRHVPHEGSGVVVGAAEVVDVLQSHVVVEGGGVVVVVVVTQIGEATTSLVTVQDVSVHSPSIPQ